MLKQFKLCKACVDGDLNKVKKYVENESIEVNKNYYDYEEKIKSEFEENNHDDDSDDYLTYLRAENNFKDEDDEFSPLELVCKYNHFDIVKYLFTQNVQKIKNFEHSLLFACQNENIEIVKLIVNSKCFKSKPNKFLYSSVLKTTCEKGNVFILEILLNYFDQKKLKKNFFLTVKDGNVEVLESFFEKIGKNQDDFNNNYVFFQNYFAKSIHYDKIDLAKCFNMNFIKRNINPTLLNKDFFKGLEYSIKKDDTKYILEFFTYLDFNYFYEKSYTLLYYAIIYKSYNCIDVLLDYSDCKISNTLGETALMLCGDRNDSLNESYFNRILLLSDVDSTDIYGRKAKIPENFQDL